MKYRNNNNIICEIMMMGSWVIALMAREGEWCSFFYIIIPTYKNVSWSGTSKVVCWTWENIQYYFHILFMVLFLPIKNIINNNQNVWLTWARTFFPINNHISIPKQFSDWTHCLSMIRKNIFCVWEWPLISIFIFIFINGVHEISFIFLSTYFAPNGINKTNKWALCDGGPQNSL